ncbi:MAG: hypothetical protein KBS40_02680, partial [Bacteroidales bacterium]|nr:hypothetical protein [Bacteroidales bacterium]
TSAIVLATGTEKMGVYAGEYEFTLDIAEDGTMTLSYAPVATGLYRINANTAIRKALINGHVVIFKNNKTFNLMGAEL